MTAGVTDITGFAANTLNSTEPHQLNVTDTYTATANREVYAVSVFANSTGTAGQQCEVGLYDITSLTTPYDGAELIASATITHGGSEEELTVNLGAPVALTEGNVYACAVRAIDNGTHTVFVMYRSGFESNAGVQSVTTGAGGALADPWDGDTTIARRYAAAALTQAASSVPTLDDVGGNDTVVVGDTEAITYSNFTSAIETATINDGGTAVTSLTVSSAGATSANITLASLNDWVGTKACPFTSSSHTGQQVTITSTNEDPDESDSLAVTFNPPADHAVTETTGFTWPPPDGSVIKGFASEPPATSQLIAPSTFTFDALGILTTDVLSDTPFYLYNATTEEGSMFMYLVESGLAVKIASIRKSVRSSIRGSIYNSVR